MIPKFAVGDTVRLISGYIPSDSLAFTVGENRLVLNKLYTITKVCYGEVNPYSLSGTGYLVAGYMLKLEEPA